MGERWMVQYQVLDCYPTARIIVLATQIVNYNSFEYLFIYLMYCIQLSQAGTNKCHIDVEGWSEVHQVEVCNVCSAHCLQLV